MCQLQPHRGKVGADDERLYLMAPTRAKAGSPAKIELLAARRRAGLPLFVEGDNHEKVDRDAPS